MRRYSLAVSLVLLSLLGCDHSQPLEPAFQEWSTGGSASTVKAPSNTNAVAVSQSRIDVSWHDNSSNETGFEVQRSKAGAAFAVLAATGAGVTTYGDVGLAPATQFCYKVRAFLTSGRKTTYSQFSATACATTPTGPQPGSLQIATATTGSHLDPDGYSVRVDGGPEQRIGTNATITIASVAGGDHNVSLSDVAVNCSVAGANPRSVSVNGGTTQVSFAVTCGDGNTIQVTAVTTGVNLDPDGYVVDLWRWPDPWSRIYAGSATVAANGTVTFYALNTGEYEVDFAGGLAANCGLIGSRSRRVDLSNGGAAAVKYDVTCGVLSRIAFADVADGNAEIYVIYADGTGRTRLTTHPATDFEPEWSPDGNKIAFVSDRDGNAEIYVMQADGSNPVRLTDHPAVDESPTWSPDGTRIAFVSNRDSTWKIYVITTDGTGTVTATNQEGVDPAWSPDGQRIAFALGAIYVMNPDGTGVTQITTPVFPDAQPTWSPDGQMLAFARTLTESGTNIWAVYTDGSLAGPMSWGGCGCELAAHPSWSPDGGFRAAFSGYGFGFGDVDRVFITSAFWGGEFLTTGFDPSWHR